MTRSSRSVAASCRSELPTAGRSHRRTTDRLCSPEDVLFVERERHEKQYNLHRWWGALRLNRASILALTGGLASWTPGIARMLDRLDEREPSDGTDRRTVLVGATESGRVLLKQSAEPLRECRERPGAPDGVPI